jgi:hypothetical protein
MTKKHFEHAALIVRAMQDRVLARIVAQYYIELFDSFNPRFDMLRFLRACGIED